MAAMGLKCCARNLEHCSNPPCLAWTCTFQPMMSPFWPRRACRVWSALPSSCSSSSTAHRLPRHNRTASDTTRGALFGHAQPMPPSSPLPSTYVLGVCRRSCPIGMPVSSHSVRLMSRLSDGLALPGDSNSDLGELGSWGLAPDS